MQRADEDRTNAVLNLIKAAKEIQGMDLEHFERSLNIVKNLEGEETTEVKPTKSSTTT